MSEYDEEAAGEALRKAAELLPDDGTGEDGAEVTQQAAQEALRALPACPSRAVLLVGFIPVTTVCARRAGSR